MSARKENVESKAKKHNFLSISFDVVVIMYFV